MVHTNNNIQIIHILSVRNFPEFKRGEDQKQNRNRKKYDKEHSMQKIVQITASNW